MLTITLLFGSFFNASALQHVLLRSDISKTIAKDTARVAAACLGGWATCRMLPRGASQSWRSWQQTAGEQAYEKLDSKEQELSEANDECKLLQHQHVAAHAAVEEVIRRGESRWPERLEDDSAQISARLAKYLERLEPRNEPDFASLSDEMLEETVASLKDRWEIACALRWLVKKASEHEKVIIAVYEEVGRVADATKGLSAMPAVHSQYSSHMQLSDECRALEKQYHDCCKTVQDYRRQRQQKYAFYAYLSSATMWQHLALLLTAAVACRRLTERKA